MECVAAFFWARLEAAASGCAAAIETASAAASIVPNMNLMCDSSSSPESPFELLTCKRRTRFAWRGRGLTMGRSRGLPLGPMKDETDEPVTLTELDGHEIYPMPMFVTLQVRDVRGIADWYARALGFATVFQAPAPDGQAPPMVHLRRRK